MWKRTIVFILFVVACLSLPAGAKRLTCGFKIGKMKLALPLRSDLPAPKMSAQIKKVLSKRFTYLDKGAQCYAFLSEDGKYVLKFFRFDQQPFFTFQKTKKGTPQSIFRFFKSCELAYEVASQETGVVYLHLNPTSGELPVLDARGPMGRPLKLHLDNYRFALQKKALPLAATLAAARKEGKLKERVEEIVSLLERRISKGIGNTDPSLWRNFGFLEDKAIEIDFGNYVQRSDFAESLNARIELERYMFPLRSWLEKNGPELLPVLNARVENTRL